MDFDLAVNCADCRDDYIAPACPRHFHAGAFILKSTPSKGERAGAPCEAFVFGKVS